MNVTRTCGMCDTPLELESDGVALRFTAHDADLCRGSTMLRIRTLERAAAQASQDSGEAQARLGAALHRHRLEMGVMQDALSQALDGWAGMYEDHRATGMPVQHPDIARLERLLSDPGYLELEVAEAKRAQSEPRTSAATSPM